jgi:DNA-binding SARP family transcriptional activator
VVYLRTLGESVIEVGEAQIGPGAPHMFAALLYLALECGRRVPRARLQELLFPTSDERSGSHSLRQLLYRMRRMGVELRADGTGVLMPVDAVRADFQQFFAPTDRARGELARISGGFLPAFSPTFSTPFAEWLEQRRAELLARICRTLTAELVEHRRAARWRLAEETARAILSLDLFNEEATLGLAEAMALNGSKLEAVQLLDSYLEEVGQRDRVLRVPATILRRRIAERLAQIPYAASSTFVGRSEALHTLRKRLASARAGDGSACHIWGDAGIGKTRLVSEFARIAVLDGLCVEHMSAQPHDIRRPMGAFTDLVPSLLRLPGALGCSPEAIAFLTKLFRYESNSAAPLSPDAREAELLSANITTAISELLDALTAESAMVLVLDDAQWLDPISLHVVADLVAERKRRALLLVLTSRNADLGMPAKHVERLSTMKLQPLSPAESSAILSDLFRHRGIDAEDELTRWCLGVAAGNPFFLHTLVLHYATTRDFQGIPEPLSILLGQRLNLLNQRARHIFSASAILGRHSTFDNLEAVLGLPKYELLDGLQTLDDLGFIASSGASIAATHALLSDIALRRTPESVRRLLHRNAARVLGQVALDENSATALWDSAEHWLESGDAHSSISALRACARHALEIGQPNDAVGALRRAAELAGTSAALSVVRRELLVACEIAGAWTQMLDVLAAIKRQRAVNGLLLDFDPTYERLELEALLNTSFDPRALVARLVRYTSDDAVPPKERLRGCVLLTAVAEDLLSPELATDAYASALSITDTDDARVHRCEFEMIYHASFGDLDRAAEAALNLLAFAEAEVNLAAQCRMTLTAGGALLRAGRFQEGVSALEACYRLACDHRLATARHRSASNLACVLRDAGRAEAGLAWQQRASAAFEQLDPPDKPAGFFSNCALFAMADGDFALAQDWVSRALKEVAPAQFGHAGLHFRALDLRIRQLANSYDCTEHELQELLDLHLQYRAFGCHDEVMEVLWHALTRKGREKEGDKLLDEYLHQHRRLRWPVTPNLAALAARSCRGLRSVESKEGQLARPCPEMGVTAGGNAAAATS